MFSDDEIKHVLDNAEAIASKCLADIFYDKPINHHARNVFIQIQNVNALFSIIDSETQLNFDIGGLTQEAINLGYKLYRIQEYIVSKL